MSPTNLTGLSIEGTDHERQSVKRSAEVEFNVKLLDALLLFFHYEYVRWLIYKWMMARCER